MKPYFSHAVVTAMIIPFAFAQEAEIVETEVVEKVVVPAPAVEVVPAPAVEVVPAPAVEVVPRSVVVVEVIPAKELPAGWASDDISIAQHIATSDSYSKLQTLIEAADYGSRLEEVAPLTFFAPNNTAFRDLNDADFQALLLPANRPRLTKLLERHLVVGFLNPDLMKTGEVMTASGERVMIVVEGKAITVGKANLSLPNSVSTNGVIHMVDKILEPVPSDK